MTAPTYREALSSLDRLRVVSEEVGKALENLRIQHLIASLPIHHTDEVLYRDRVLKAIEAPVERESHVEAA